MESVPKKFSSCAGMIHYSSALSSSSRLMEVLERDDIDSCIGCCLFSVFTSRFFDPLATSSGLGRCIALTLSCPRTVGVPLHLGTTSRVRRTATLLSVLREPSVSHLSRARGLGCLDDWSAWTIGVPPGPDPGVTPILVSLVSREFHTPHARDFAFQVNVLRVCFLGWGTYAYRNVVFLTDLFSSLTARARVFISSRFVPWGTPARGIGFRSRSATVELLASPVRRGVRFGVRILDI